MSAADLDSAVAETTVAGAPQAIATDLASATTVAIGPYPLKIVTLSRRATTMPMFAIVGVVVTVVATAHSSGLNYFAGWRYWPEG